MSRGSDVGSRREKESGSFWAPSLPAPSFLPKPLFARKQKAAERNIRRLMYVEGVVALMVPEQRQ
jgi:hypothetical protein